MQVCKRSQLLSVGAVVYASDVRKSAAEQIESVGGRFIEVDGMDDFEDEAGYAKPLTPEFIQKVNDTVCGVASDADIIVTTARIFGRPAPITVPSSAVKDFKSGAVVVDMNADVGGNCEDTVAGEVITTDNGVIVVGTSNLPAQLLQLQACFIPTTLRHLSPRLWMMVQS